MTPVDLLADLEARGLVQDTTDRDALRERLAAGPVTLYCGFDPTADSLHIGNLIGLLALRRFRDAGHDPIAVAGGATGMVGDPSGRSEERNLLDDATLLGNLEMIGAQVAQISNVDVVDNASWTRDVTFLEFLRDIGKHVTVNQMVGKESVRARMEGDAGISFTEFCYMLLQAFDYLELHRQRGCTLQVGGSDQWGNIVTGIDLVRKVTGASVHGLTWPLLLRSDGKKFGKSESGNVWLGAHRTSPYQFFQYWMNVPDADVRRFLLQLTLLPVADCHAIADAHDAAPERREGQRRLAREVTALVHGTDATAAAEEASAILFGGSPTGASAQALAFLADEVPTSSFAPGAGIAETLAATPLASSLSDARRTVGQGAAYVNGERADDGRLLGPDDLLHGRWVVLRKGKRNYHLLDAG